MAKEIRAALYLRVSTDEQTVENQRRDLTTVAELRRWTINPKHIYVDASISGAKDRHQRPGFDAMLRAGARHSFNVLMFWSIDRLGRGVATVATALAELDAAGIAIYAHKEQMDATTPHGRAMLQMAAVFAELERGMIRARVQAGIDRVKAEQVAGIPRYHANGMKKKPIGGQAKDEAIRKQAIQLREDGVPFRVIAQELGISQGAVFKWVQEKTSSAAA